MPDQDYVKIIENPSCDTDLPQETQAKIKELVEGGWIREVLMITANGEVLVDPELVSYDESIQSQHPGRPRSEYIRALYPERIFVRGE